MKESIKELLELGFTISNDYKEKIEEWYSEIKISKNDDNSYYLQPKYVLIHGLDNAVDLFCYETYSSKNVGYVQKRLKQKGLLNDDSDLCDSNGEFLESIEHPGKKMKKLFKEESKLVDEEFNKLNININKFPTIEDAREYIENAVKIETSEELKKSLEFFNKKFSMLNIYIGINPVYDTGASSGFVDLFYLNEGSLDILRKKQEYNEYNDNKELVTKEKKFLYFELTFSERGTDLSTDYKLKI